MRPPLTTVEQAAAAAHLMKYAGATALLVLDGHTDQPIGIITQADIARAVADGKDVNRVRIYDLMTTRPTAISPPRGWLVRIWGRPDVPGLAPWTSQSGGNGAPVASGRRRMIFLICVWPGRNIGPRRRWRGRL